MPRPAVPPAPPPGWGITDPATGVLRLGSHTLEVTDEAVVLGRLAPTLAARRGGPRSVQDEELLQGARRLVAAGAAAVEVQIPAGSGPGDAGPVDALVAVLDVPVVAAVGDGPCLEVALTAGAAGVLPTGNLTADHLALVAASGASLLLTAGAADEVDQAAVGRMARAAVDNGLAPDRLLVDITATVPDLALPGLPVLVSDPLGADDTDGSSSRRAERSAVFALGIARGGRVLRTTDPHSARRTSVTLAAVRRGWGAHRGAPA